MSTGASPADRQQLRFSLPSFRKPHNKQSPSDPSKLYQKSNALIDNALSRARSAPNAQQSMSPGLSRAILIPNPFL